MARTSAANRRDRRAAVIGGSISGLFAAAFLRQIGWHVDIYERSPVELVGRGVGIFAGHPELPEALKKSGARTDNLGVIVDKRISIDRRGQVIAEKLQRQILTSWDRLRHLLFKTIDPGRYHFGHTFARVEQDGSEVLVHFAEGRTERADLVVGADGLRSSVRRQVAPDVQPIYSGYYIWRGAPNEADLSAETLQCLFPYVAFFLAGRLQMLGYPISGLNDDLRPGHRRYNFAWYRVADPQQLKEMCVDEEGRQHEFSVPLPLIRKDLIAQMRAHAEELLPPPFVDCLRNIDRPFFTPIYDFSSYSLVFGRIALVGDAASTPRPHIGFGVAKAAVEAQALTDALRDHDDIDRALAEYNAVRQPMAERIVLHGRKLGTQLGVNLKTDEDRRMWKLLQSPEAILDWIAVPNFLRRVGE
jgi:2-polyprenyl-6-methoxyphenol hydroxylase-like FAD-dependent oxidoreductase